MIDELLQERYELARERISELTSESVSLQYDNYVQQTAHFFQKITKVLDASRDHKLLTMTLEELVSLNDAFYDELRDNHYETSFANPTYATKQFGEQVGTYLCYFAARFRDAISYAYCGKLEPVLLRMELFLQIVSGMVEEDFLHECKEITYYDAYDYSDMDTMRRIRELLDPSEDYFTQIVMESDFSDIRYLYLYGENITDNEIRMAKHLHAIPKEQLVDMARTYTEGFKKGFELAGIDLSKKKAVNIRYSIGFEPMVKQAILQFRKMGLEPLLYTRTNTASMGIISTPANPQYQYDHRYDDSLYLNKAISKKRLLELRQSYEKMKDLANDYAGPACIEVFGQKLFVPVVKKEALHYTKAQEKISIDHRRDAVLIQNEYIPRDQYSFTIIAYPVPEIGEQFEEIFDATVDVNTLDMNQYREIQQKLIDALDQGDYVYITGRGENKTNLRVKLHELKDKKQETNFENCLADVNIPVGEVFTSPVLKGTTGTLHVTQVYLEELRYEDFTLEFTDGMITSYSCSNYENQEDNKKYIKENVLKNRETLPMGEFAIGTNTTAYMMGRRFNISHKLPILIAEKTGPHFAVGDTCYSMSEDIVVRNPDGKEIIAKDNECSILRETNPSKAYMNCHTDITIPYSELGDIVVHTIDGKEIELIHQGRFVLPGTESLNDVLDDTL